MALELRTQKKALREERAKLVADARKVLEKAEGEKRAMSADEREQWDRMNDAVDTLGKRIETLESQAANEDEDEDEREEEEGGNEEEGDDERDADEEDDEDAERANGRIITLTDGRRAQIVSKGKPKRGKPGREVRAKQYIGETDEQFRTRQRRSSPEYRKVFWDYFCHGPSVLSTRFAQRAISADSDIVGGYLVAPMEFQGDLIKFVDNQLWLRQLATKYTVSAAQSLGAPSLDVDISAAQWTSELATGNVDTAMTFGKRELTPRPLAKRIQISQKLLRMGQVSKLVQAEGAPSSGGVEGLVRSRLGYQFSVAEENAFQNGSGSNQPIGLFTASSRGIPTTQDFVCGSTSAITADLLIASKYNLKPQYYTRPSTRWLFSRAALLQIRQLKDSYGQYLWKPGLASDTVQSASSQDSLLDIPTVLSEYVPAIFTTGSYVGMIGDFSFYWIVDSEQMVIQRLVELYAEANEIGFIARRELDGMPVLAEAFTRLRLA